MQHYAEAWDIRLDCVFALGDNCYPRGCTQATLPEFFHRWQGTFLRHQRLRVPWVAVLGNHDYMGDPDAQLRTPGQEPPERALWIMPHRNYRFAFELKDGTRVDCFMLDSCGVQNHVRRSHPGSDEQLRHNVSHLHEGLKCCGGGWKLAFAHHPMYTQGAGHAPPARCLRERGQGDYNLESLLLQHKAQAYFAGHEHAQQQHEKDGLCHVGVGSAAERGFYGGMAPEGQTKLDWYDRKAMAGFVHVRINEARMEVLFMQPTATFGDHSVVHKVEVKRWRK